VRLAPASSGDIAVFDVTVGDSEGRVLIDVQGFTMKRVDKSAAIVQSERDLAESAGRRRAFQQIAREAIGSDEGLLALDRVLGQTQLDQMVVSSVDVSLWLDQLETSAAADEVDSAETGGTFSRPALGTEYAAPGNSLEQVLAGMWSKLLGVDHPGVSDDFFELGGDSLVAVRLFARIKKQLGVSLPISTLFQAPTIRALATLLVEQGVEVEEGKRVDDPSQRKFVPFSAVLGSRRHSVAPREPGLYELSWRATDSLPLAKGVESGRCWLLFLDDVGLGRFVKQRLVAFGHSVILVRSGDGYARNGSTDYTVAPENGRESCRLLFRDLVDAGQVPTDILHLWLVTKDQSFRLGSSFYHRTQEEGCFSLLSLAQALADLELDAPMNVTCVTSSLYLPPTANASRRREPTVHDSKATVLGVVDTMPAELPRVRARHIDLELGRAAETGKLSTQLGDAFRTSTLAEHEVERLGTALLAEVLSEHDRGTVLLTAARRFELDWRPVRSSAPEPPGLLREAVYCLLGRPTPLVAEIARILLGRGPASFVWMYDPSFEGGGVEESIEELRTMLKGAGVRLTVVQCDATSRSSVLESIRGQLGEHHRLGGAVLSGIGSTRELMQLLEPGAAEETLAEQVQSAQVLTDTVAALDPAAFVLLIGSQQELQAVDGEATLRSGNAFFVSHAQRCRQRGQLVTSLFERARSGSHDSGEFDLSGGSSRLVVEALSGRNRTSGALWLVAGRPQVASPLAVDDDSPRSSRRSDPPASNATAVLPLFREATGIAELEPQTSLAAVGTTRLAAARLMTHIKNHYELGQPVVELLRRPSAARIAALIGGETEEGAPQHSFKYLVPMHPQKPGRGTPFFLVAGMFGNILNLRHLGRLLGADREVYGIQARGLFGDEKPHRTIEEMAEAYLEEIRLLLPKGPYLLGGFSGGGLVAYEMAKRLREAGEGVPIVVLLDTPLPQRPELTYRDRMVMQWIKLQRGGAGYVAEWAKNRASWELELVRRRFHEVDETYTPGTFKYDAIQQAFLGAAAAYRLSPYPGKVALYRPALDKAYQVGPDRFVNSSRELVLNDQGWSPYVADVEVWEVPGDHDHMVLEPDVRVLAGLLRRRLADVQESS
jgi:thioesterase domain-containing protein/acyl carrier protein